EHLALPGEEIQALAYLIKHVLRSFSASRRKKKPSSLLGTKGCFRGTTQFGALRAPACAPDTGGDPSRSGVMSAWSGSIGLPPSPIRFACRPPGRVSVTAGAMFSLLYGKIAGCKAPLRPKPAIMPGKKRVFRRASVCRQRPAARSFVA